MIGKLSGHFENFGNSEIFLSVAGEPGKNAFSGTNVREGIGEKGRRQES